MDFDGKSQMITDYNFRGLDLIQWQVKLSAFGVSRYTGGDSERVIILQIKTGYLVSFQSNWKILFQWLG